MTLEELDARLKIIDPLLHVRYRGQGNITGVFHGSEYVTRMDYGELNVNGFRWKYYGRDLSVREGRIQKRGRKTLIKLLGNHVKTLEDKASILWGI